MVPSNKVELNPAFQEDAIQATEMINDDLLATIFLLNCYDYRVDAPKLQLQNDHLK